MRTKSYHISNLGSYAPHGCADFAGFVIYHESPRYSRASESQLSGWSRSRIRAVRNAARTELAERALEAWRSR